MSSKNTAFYLNNASILVKATDYIELKEEFTVPLGSSFTAITHCNTCSISTP